VPGLRLAVYAPAVSQERLAVLRRLAEQDPNDAVAWFGYGRACLAAEQADEARRAFERALALDPRWSAAWRDLGRARLEAGDAAAAVEALERGIEVARERGDLQTVREMEVFLKRARRRLAKGT
jgi:tetratricopeptide (TPR) repeat protein